MPSTLALFTISRKFIIGEDDIPVFQTFWKTYRNEFLKGNALGLILLLGGALWYADFTYFKNAAGTFSPVFHSLMIVVGFVYLVILLYVFPVYVHYDKKFFQYFKQAAVIGLLQPASLFLMLVCTLLNVCFLLYFQGFIPLISVSLICYVNMWIALKSFQHIENKSLKTTNKWT
ncbi:YesL family protein [Domibacillus robiginosus]|uniref:YesL family protein n=1 Tax=Domibacillus robiginosus TaxID=1071054 RepID=UPI000A8A208A|nr:DUF624 domain-containing protein [Domibacillus robiginosus]